MRTVTLPNRSDRVDVMKVPLFPSARLKVRAEVLRRRTPNRSQVFRLEGSIVSRHSATARAMRKGAYDSAEASRTAPRLRSRRTSSAGSGPTQNRSGTAGSCKVQHLTCSLPKESASLPPLRDRLGPAHRQQADESRGGCSRRGSSCSTKPSMSATASSVKLS